VHDDRGYATLKETGGLVLSSASTRGFIARTRAHFDEFRIPYEMLDRDQLDKR
jgi:hypothetical protein